MDNRVPRACGAAKRPEGCQGNERLMTRKEASPGGAEGCTHQRDPLSQQGVWLWRPRGAGESPSVGWWWQLLLQRHLETFPPPSAVPLEPRWPLLKVNRMLNATSAPGQARGSRLLPMAARQLLHPESPTLHIGLTGPNLHPDALDTVPCKQGVHLEDKSVKALTFYLRLLPHSPAGHRSVGPQGGAWHSRPQGAHGPWPVCRRHTSSPPHTTGARQRVLGTCARAPLPSSHSSAHSSHTRSLSRTLHNSHANSCSHIHSHTHS